MQIKEILSLGPLIPVVVIDDANAAVPLAKALIAGGIRVIEVTLRTATALAAIRRIAAEVPDAIVGAGTILRPEQFAEIEQAGAAFAVSPGATPRTPGRRARLEDAVPARCGHRQRSHAPL